MIKEGYFAKIKEYPEDEVKLVVSRKYPWFLGKTGAFTNYPHEPELGPSQWLLDNYKNGAVNWEGYVHMYKFDLLTNPETWKPLSTVARIGAQKDIRLLCWEKALDHKCHRFLLLEILEAFGLDVQKEGEDKDE